MLPGIHRKVAEKTQQYDWNCLNLSTASKIMSLLLYFLITLRWHLKAGIRTTSWTMVKYWIPTSMSLLPYIFQAPTAGQVPSHNTLACLSHLAESVKRCVVFYLFLGPGIKMGTRFQILQFTKWWSLFQSGPLNDCVELNIYLSHGPYLFPVGP